MSKELQSVISSNPEFSEEHFIEITPTLLMLVKSKLQTIERKSLQGNRDSNDIIQLAINIFFVCPKLYRIMQKSLVSLIFM
jgi:hypothetical protein